MALLEFSQRGRTLSAQYHEEKLRYMFGHNVFVSSDFKNLNDDEKADFYKGFMDEHEDVYPMCMAEINEILPTPEEFWRWYDSNHRVRNQISMEDKAHGAD